MLRTSKYLLLFLLIASVISCNNTGNTEKENAENEDTLKVEKSEMQKKVDEYAEVELKTDLSVLTENQRKMLPLLFKAADIMEEIYWVEAFGDKEELFSSIKDDATKKFVKINYGPWERLNGNEPFIDGYGKKPKGANFYPKDMTKEEFENWDDEDKLSLYTLIRRDDKGNLESIPYHVAFEKQIKEASDLLKQAAELAEDEGFKKYLELRAEALLTDKYYESDIAWMEMKDNHIDFIVGPIENYEDGLFNAKAAHESFILIKDKEWSDKLNRFAELLPQLQKDLPVEQKYKDEMPGNDSDLGAYEAIYYAGDCNAGSKTIAINLPNDERVRNNKGSRKLQLKNSMKAKFDKILVPISDLLIDESQRKNIKFDAFFENTMFHEVGHGLGLSMTIDKKQTVREALKDQYTALEEGKADILGLYIVTKLYDQGELTTNVLMDNYVTFMASIFRSIRFGVSSSHGKANMVRFYYFQEKGAFTKDAENGTYKVDFEKMKSAMKELGNMILKIQGDGDYDAAKKLIDEKGFIREELQKDLDRISEAGIPRDIVFKQGPKVVGL